MRKLMIIGTLAVGAIAFAPLNLANAFVPVQTHIAGTAATLDDFVKVKRKKSARPPGWSRGRKVGWRGGRKPPGQRR